MGLKLKQKQTDNSYLEDKIALRLNCIPKLKTLRVLDCYHGSGSIWKNIQKKYGGNIKILKIDKEQKDDGFVLIGENEKYIKSLNLNNFDVVDLDAYGVPYEQLKEVFKQGFKGWVFVTFIQTVMGCLPHEFLIDIGYTKEMIEKCPTLFYGNGFKKMCNFLEKNGVTKIKYRSHQRKNYIAFTLG
jgi:hypothetical protein